MSMQTPPNIDANDRGISSFEGLTRMAAATDSMMGMKMATIGVLFMNAESRPTLIIITDRPAHRFHENTRAEARPSTATAPVRDRPAEMTGAARGRRSP